MKRRNLSGITVLAAPALLAVAVLWLFSAMNGIQRGESDEAALQLEEAVRRSAVACYADEGAYPDNLDYIKEHYGLQIDEDRFAVIYDAFASNLMPDITVIVK